MYLDITSRDAILYETYITEKKKLYWGTILEILIHCKTIDK